MATNAFTLAALATTAVPELKVVAATDDGSDNEFTAAALRLADGSVVRAVVPRTPGMLARMHAQSIATAAFTGGVRQRLPFDVPTLLGSAELGKTAIFVWTRLGGRQMQLRALSPSAPALADSIADALATLHALPTSVVADAGLPHRTLGHVRQEMLDVFDRAAATGRVPAPLLGRWERALEDSALWQFKPTVVHGDIQAQAFVVNEDTVSGLRGWHALAIGDPARDLAWLLGSEQFGVVDDIFERYRALRDNGDRQLRQRAMLHAELELAKWLLYGHDNGDQTVVNDAAEMLSGLVARVDDDSDVAIAAKPLDTMDLTGVQELLSSRGDAVDTGEALVQRRRSSAEQETEAVDLSSSSRD